MKNLHVISNGRTVSILIDRAKTYIFDMAGRPLVLTHDGRTFVRGLDGRIKEKTWKGSFDNFDRIIRDLDESDIRHLTFRLYEDVEAAKSHVESHLPFDFNRLGEAEKEFATVGDVFSRLLYWSPDQLVKDSERFHQIYHPINILPPDQYFCIPLQVVEGCPWNKCSFCHFYRGRKFRVRPLKEVFQHMSDVRNFLGRSLELRHSVFLCDANALAAPMGELIEILSAVNAGFHPQTVKGGGISTFADVVVILGRTKAELIRLKEKGLRRVYIGMESGSNDLRKVIRKPGNSHHLRRAVSSLKDAGMEVGLVVLVGIGGREYEKAHIKETVAVLNDLPIGQRDIVYFSPFYPSEASDYALFEETKNLQALTKEEIRRQYRTMLNSLDFQGKKDSPLTAVYDIREFVV